MNTGNISVSPATANYLNSLRAIEQAKFYYYEANREIGGEAFAEQQLDAHAAEWGALGALLKQQIGDAVDFWAQSDTQSAI